MTAEENDTAVEDYTEITCQSDAITYFRNSDMNFPDGLELEKHIKSRATNWVFHDSRFSFEIVRHPTPLFALEVQGCGTPARWHVYERYTYDLDENNWDVDCLQREFHYDPVLLVQAVFDTQGQVWDDKIARVQEADDREGALQEEFAPVAENYRSMFPEVSEETFDEMMDVLRSKFRSLAGVD